MANIWHVSFVIVASALVLVVIAWWSNDRHSEPELLLGNSEQLTGPLAPDELKVSNPGITNTMNRTATFTTNRGVFVLELFEDQMPVTTGNFIKLAEEGFYDGTKFHRVINNFMIQAGDPNSKSDDAVTYGRGGPGYTIKDEFVAGELLTNKRGTIAMANTGQPDSGGSQFFLNTVDNVGLDFDKEPFQSKHPVFGRVISGMDVVDAISKTEVGTADLPVESVVIESITISKTQSKVPQLNI